MEKYYRVLQFNIYFSNIIAVTMKWINFCYLLKQEEGKREERKNGGMEVCLEY